MAMLSDNWKKKLKNAVVHHFCLYSFIIIEETFNKKKQQQKITWMARAFAKWNLKKKITHWFLLGPVESHLTGKRRCSAVYKKKKTNQIQNNKTITLKYGRLNLN